MASKLGIHITMATQAEQMRDFMLAAQPAIVKLVDPDRPMAEWIRVNCPNTLLVGRKYMGNQPWADPDRLYGGLVSMSAFPVIDVWEGYNEPPRNRLEDMCRTDAEVARRLHDVGKKYVCGSWSVGNPDIPDWQNPLMLAALREADYIGVHEYNAPTLDDSRGTEWFMLRHRLWYPNLPADCQKPLLITECGVDSNAPGGRWNPGAVGGWQSFTNAQGYMNQLLWYEWELQRDPYVQGATLFQWGSRDPQWRTYDHTPEFNALLREHMIAMRGDEPMPPDEDDEDDGWPYRGGIDVSQHQGMIDWLAVSNSKTVERVIIRASAGLKADRLYHHNWIRTGEMGFARGSYHYLTYDDPWEQAYLFSEMVGEREGYMGCFLDVEDPNIGSEHVLSFVRAWEAITEYRDLGIYSSPALWQQIMDGNLEWAKSRDLWIAHWGVDHPTLPPPWTDFVAWQYSSTGAIPGIQGSVDLDWFK